jgi:hypothetical protein
MDRKEFDQRLEKDPMSLAAYLYKNNILLQSQNDMLRRRIDPQLSEKAVLGNLSLPSLAENAEPLQIGAMLSLVAVFDRKLNRELFLEMAESTTALFGMLGRLSIAESVLHLMRSGVFDQAKIETAVKELVVFADAERNKIIKAMELVTQCPQSDDKIN